MRKVLIILVVLSFILAISGALSKVFMQENENSGNIFLTSSAVLSALTFFLFLFYILKKRNVA